MKGPERIRKNARKKQNYLKTGMDPKKKVVIKKMNKP